MYPLAWLNQRRAEKAISKRLSLQKGNDIFYPEFGFMHNEVIETIEEEGHKILVGATATWDVNWQILPLTTDLSLKLGYTTSSYHQADIELTQNSTLDVANWNMLLSVHVSCFYRSNPVFSKQVPHSSSGLVLSLQQGICPPRKARKYARNCPEP
jgi:hypothetical protein